MKHRCGVNQSMDCRECINSCDLSAAALKGGKWYGP